MNFFGLLKKLSLLALALLFPLSVFAQTFSDVPTYHKHYKSIASLSSAGVINGYPDKKFRPYKTINRAEAVKILSTAQFNDSAINGCIAEYTASHWHYAFFKDVLIKNTWYSKYVCAARTNNVVDGYPDGLFRPGNTINFAEGLKVIIEGYGIDVSSEKFSENSLLYVNGDEWFAPYFAYAYSKNLINRNKFYHPAQSMTRGEFIEIIHRIKTVKNGGLTEFSSASTTYSSEYTITIPRLNIVNLNVSFADLYNESAALATLKDGLGHYMNPPGDGKKVVIFGHSSGYSWDKSAYKRALRKINKLQDGDRIYINYQEKGYVYQVSSREIIAANQAHTVLQDFNYEEVALYTCWPPDSIRQRYVVYAVKI